MSRWFCRSSSSASGKDRLAWQDARRLLGQDDRASYFRNKCSYLNPPTEHDEE